MRAKDKRRMEKTEQLRRKAIAYASYFNYDITNLKNKSQSCLKKYLNEAKRKLNNMMSSLSRREKINVSNLLLSIK